jgi:hypothetical protein
MPEGDKKNQIVEQINYLCQELGAENNVCSQIEVEECYIFLIFVAPIWIPPLVINWQYL